jgi:hypothetical protein
MIATMISGVSCTDSANALVRKVHDTADRVRGVAEGAPASSAAVLRRSPRNPVGEVLTRTLKEWVAREGM